jgi:hypothetical protein
MRSYLLPDRVMITRQDDLPQVGVEMLDQFRNHRTNAPKSI